MTIREKVSAALKEKTGAGFVGLGIADTAINAFLAAAAEDGWHMRPDEMTDEMIARVFEIDSLRLAYRAMQAAAPEFEWEK